MRSPSYHGYTQSPTRDNADEVDDDDDDDDDDDEPYPDPNLSAEGGELPREPDGVVVGHQKARARQYAQLAVG